MTKKLYIETYGCQMNFSDSEIVASIIKEQGTALTENIKEADVILINTCSVRDKAEQRIRNRLQELKSLKKKNPNLKIGIIGCMAERLKEQLFDEEETLDLLAGPDSYRNLPELLELTETGQKAANTLLSQEETYADIHPVRYDNNGVTAFISIMRGCENFCSYCIVPYTRGKERSRDPQSIINETKDLLAKGFKEITLLGQNVNSYRWQTDSTEYDFPQLLKEVALIDPTLRIRFTTSHPKDLSDKLLHTIAAHPNICKHIHLALQSGSTRILSVMNRKYTREWFMDRITAIRTIIPTCAITTDIIAGFCTETESDHQDTLNLMEFAKFDVAYMFKYSVREGTDAAKTLPDDVPEAIKLERLNEIIKLHRKHCLQSNKQDIGKTFEVLTEGLSKRSSEMITGCTTHNKLVVFPKEGISSGQYVQVKITDCTAATLLGVIEK